jgi:hypothetical protein
LQKMTLLTVLPRSRTDNLKGRGATLTYEAAGGVVLRNLFQSDDGGWLEDVALLDGLVAEKRKAEAETIAAEGWKWIELPGCEAHRPVRQLSALSLGGIRPLAWTCAATRA